MHKLNTYRAATLLAAGLLGMAGSAQAGVIAYAYNALDSLHVGGAAIVPVSGWTFNDSSSSASLTGAVSLGLGGALDAPTACLGNNCPQPGNDFGTTHPAPHLALGDALILGNGESAAASTTQKALVNLDVTGTTGAASGSNALSWVFDWAGGDLSIDFVHYTYVKLLLEADADTGSMAGVSQAIRLTLTDGGGYSEVRNAVDGTWFLPYTANPSDPDDFLLNACATGCTAAESFDGLAAGYYQLFLDISSTADATFFKQATGAPLPEPATLALLGLGLVGLGLVLRRIR